MGERTLPPQEHTVDEAETYVYLCTSCPLGCRLEVDAVDGDVIEVRGNSCKRGIKYGKQEHIDPRRAVSTTVWLHGGPCERLPVRAAEPVPKDEVRAFVDALQGLVVEAPVPFGAVLLSDVAGTGIDLIATREIAAPREAAPVG
jgi:CxxC motif-containing protein